MRADGCLLPDERVVTRGKILPDGHIRINCRARADDRIRTDDTAGILFGIQVIAGRKTQDNRIKNYGVFSYFILTIVNHDTAVLKE
jgi:hypothetical protein